MHLWFTVAMGLQWYTNNKIMVMFMTLHVANYCEST